MFVLCINPCIQVAYIKLIIINLHKKGMFLNINDNWTTIHDMKDVPVMKYIKYGDIKDILISEISLLPT